MDDPLRLYTAAEWAAMTEHEKELLAEDRRRTVEAAREEHAEHLRLVESLTTERFAKAKPPW